MIRYKFLGLLAYSEGNSSFQFKFFERFVLAGMGSAAKVFMPLKQNNWLQFLVLMLRKVVLTALNQEMGYQKGSYDM